MSHAVWELWGPTEAEEVKRGGDREEEGPLCGIHEDIKGLKVSCEMEEGILLSKSCQKEF